MKRTASLLLSTVVFAQVSPAFAYQAHNWPGIASNASAADEAAPVTPGMMEQMMNETLPSGMDPATVLTRAEFVRLLVNALYPTSAFDKCLGHIIYKDNPDYRLLFIDVGIDHPAAKEICMAMRTGLVRGYDDGTFRPNQNINFAEASKLLSRVFALTPYPSNDPRVLWYRPYVDALSSRNIIPQTIASFGGALTVGDLKEMLYRIQFDITWRPSLSSEELRKKSEKLLRAAR